ncbi:thiamine-phosphate kinase [Moraxella sp. ZY200743]|uniref:thiamine-phosphate kinase n=1 Tax=Moraxella sp. ZY200743 TaxID=2911970 RepID=UPI003D7D454F
MSEFSLINTHFKNSTNRHQNTVLGIGDDCAVSTISANTELVSCMDTLIAGRHFAFETTAYAIGYKSVAVNLSDLASMGATPYAILLGLSLPKNNANWLKEFALGVSDICNQFHVELIGGDTTKSDVLTISVTALGFIKKGQAIKRGGAKIGDMICVSGNIGTASLALSHILTGQQTTLQNALDLPMPKVDLGQKLVGYASSMIDISDGLGQDLGHILTAGGVGAVLHLEDIPCDDEVDALPFDKKYQHILNGGDDYELCFTISKDNFDKFNALHPNQIFKIGKITEQQGLQLYHRHQKVDIAIQGWEHF